MVKKIIPAMIVLTLFMGVPFGSWNVSAEELSASPEGVGSSEGMLEGSPPSLSRNPFVSAPEGRMKRITVTSDHQPDAPKKGNRSYGQSRTGDVKDLKVKGVLLNGERPSALVGYRIVKIGDRIDEFIVTDITHAGVTLSNGDAVIQLYFEP